MIRYEIMYAVWVHIDQIEYNFKVRYLFYYETEHNRTTEQILFQ